MTNKRIIVYGLLLCCASLLFALSLSPGQAYARYYAGASWNAVIHNTSQTTPILTKTTKSLTLPISSWDDGVCIIEKMQADGTFTEYTSDGLAATLSAENAIVTLGEALPPAGTYRLVISSMDRETVIQTVTFFINYSDG